MRFKQLIEKLKSYRLYSCPSDFEVRGIGCNSKDIKDNFIFVAIKGSRQDGNKFIAEAINSGAKAVVVDSLQLRGNRLQAIGQGQHKVSVIAVKDTRKTAAQLAAEFYANPSRKIKVIGITGTNGKTTVSYLMEAVLKEAGFSPAVVGTVNYRFKNKIIPSKNTTPGPVQLQSLLADMANEGINYAIMEVSSHALDQDRVWAVDFSSTVFTNFSQDHLDYHKTLKNYFQAKAKLFKNTKAGAFAVINSDDKYANKLRELTCAQTITYGIDNPADITAADIKFDIARTGFILITAKGKTNFETKLIGRHNVYNILAAVSWAYKEGIDLAVIKSAIDKFSLVPGRLERIDCKAGFLVFVDYAHTEDALKNVIKTLRQLSPKRVIVLFGCGGERDKAKRPKMGYVVSELADYAVITSDNPRSEDPGGIAADIKKGIRKDNYCVILDRYKAIAKSLSLVKRGDILLVAGKGHESRQILKGRAVSFDDRKVIKECLRSMNY